MTQTAEYLDFLFSMNEIADAVDAEFEAHQAVEAAVTIEDIIGRMAARVNAQAAVAAADRKVTAAHRAMCAATGRNIDAVTAHIAATASKVDEVVW